MKRIPLLLFLAGCAMASPPEPASGQAPVAITGVTVIDATGAPPKPGQTVVVSGGRIAAVGPRGGTRVPAGARVIDGTGRYLIPGLWDMHVHTMREGRAPRFYPLFVANGVTSVREMGTFLDSLDHWRARATPDAPAPRIAAAGHIVNGPPPAGVRRPPPNQPTPAWVFALPVSTPEEARAAVETVAARRVDFVKTYSALSRDAYQALAAAARARGLPFAGHVPDAVTPAEASDAGQRTMEHLTGILDACAPEWDARMGEAAALARRPDAAADSVRALRNAAIARAHAAYDAAACAPLYARFVANGTYQTPTLVVLRGIGRRQEASATADPRLQYVPAEIQARWRPRPRADSATMRAIHDTNLRMVRDMHRAGVPILAGTDASDEAYVFAGFSLHDELAFFVEAGMTPLEALRTATALPARALGLEATAGTVEVGKRADLVLLDADPLRDIRNTQRIRAVVLDGRVFDRAALDALLQRVEQLAGSR